MFERPGHRCFRCDDCADMDRLARLRDSIDAEIRALYTVRCIITSLMWAERQRVR